MQTFLNQYSLIIFSVVIVFAIFLFIGLTRIKITWISLGVLFIVVCILALQSVNSIVDSKVSDSERIENARNSGEPLVLYFYSNYWIACLSLKPVVDRLQKQLKDEVVFVALDATSEYGKKTYHKYKTNQVPTFIVFDSEFKEVMRFRGRAPKFQEIFALIK